MTAILTFTLSCLFLIPSFGHLSFFLLASSELSWSVTTAYQGKHLYSKSTARKF